MTKYHQLEDGSLAICRATKKPCPKGNAIHIEAYTLEEAQRKLEESSHKERTKWIDDWVEKVNKDKKPSQIEPEDYAQVLDAEMFYDGQTAMIIPTIKTVKYLDREEAMFVLKNGDSSYISSFDCPDTWVHRYIEDNNVKYNKDDYSAVYNSIAQDLSKYKDYVKGWVESRNGVYDEAFKRCIHRPFKK